jgi:putative photosynthetic complex assembly protein 2
MVSLASFALPFLAVIALWFISTGLVAMIHHRLRQSQIRALIVAGLCASGGLSLIALTVNITASWAIYVSFLGGLLIWSWHEISFLTGAIAGPQRGDCPQEAQGWERFSLASMTVIHHEIALAMTALLLLLVAAVTLNPAGAYTFALLFVFRLSSKLNIYRGVPHFSDELLPQHMEYLKSYFGPQSLHPMLIISIITIIGLGAYLGLSAYVADNAYLGITYALLSCLSLLAALEHIFLSLPVRDSALWQWALTQKSMTQKSLTIRDNNNRT